HHSLRLVDNLGVGFVGEREDSDGFACRRQSCDALTNARYLPAIDLVRSPGEGGIDMVQFGKARKRGIVAGETWTTVAERALKILPADPGVQPDRLRDRVCVSARHTLAI